MEFGITFLVVVVLIAGIWIFIELKRMRHKIFAIFLIGLILFSYISFLTVVKNNPNLDLGTAAGMFAAGKAYLSWLGSVFDNIKTVTAQVIGLDWSADPIIR